jgi:vacuolar-type H+-ATPase subunit E/Vma4
MALEDLIQVLRREADAEVAAILAAATTEVDAIRARSETDLASRRSALLAEQEASRQSSVELALAVARRGARREVLEARERLLQRVFAASRARFPDALATAEYRAALAGQLAEATECLPPGRGTLRYHPALKPELRQLVGARGGIRLVPDSSIGSGFGLVSEDGAMEIDGTLEDRLMRLETRIRQQVVADLETETKP